VVEDAAIDCRADSVMFISLMVVGTQDLLHDLGQARPIGREHIAPPFAYSAQLHLPPPPFARRHAMPDLFDNPMGLMGFEFVEFASPTPGVLEPLFEQMGFTLVARHRSKDVLLYRQGDINFIVNREPRSLAGYFAAEHGPSACGLAFRVRDAHKAYALALERGAQPVDIPTGPMELRLPAIKGIGGAPLYLIDRFEDGKSIYDIDFEFLPGTDPASATRRAMA
jgi:4-hydroxyphenylpyruvate dioxygenase-like putative hemolysin